MNNQQNNQNETITLEQIQEAEKKYWQIQAELFTAYIDLINISKQFKEQNNGKI